jgi:hypothetical protein
MECKYCSTNEHGSGETVITSGDGWKITMTKWKNEPWILEIEYETDYNTRVYKEIRIWFCPACGRELVR